MKGPRIFFNGKLHHPVEMSSHFREHEVQERVPVAASTHVCHKIGDCGNPNIDNSPIIAMEVLYES